MIEKIKKSSFLPEKKGFLSEIKNRTPRDKFEAILDANGLGKNNLKALGELCQFNEANGIYTQSKIVLIFHIGGTEVKQRLFSEFYKMDLDSDEKALHGFYHQLKDKVKIVDTPESEAYRYFFANKALMIIRKDTQTRNNVDKLYDSLDIKTIERIVNQQSIAHEICKEAVKLSQKYFPEKLYKYDEKFFLRKLDDLDHDYKKSHRKFKRDIEKTYRNIVDHHDDEDGDKHLATELKKAKEIRLTRAGHEFFKDAPNSYRLLLQAMYTNKTISATVSADKEFVKFRSDRGERAIESYLFSKRAEKDPSIVTAVISEDQGACASIQSLRKKTQNTVFVLNSYELIRGMVDLGIYKKMEDGLSKKVVTEYENKRQEFLKIIEGDDRYKDNFRHPKWAKRFVEVIKFGRWFEPGQERQISK